MIRKSLWILTLAFVAGSLARAQSPVPSRVTLEEPPQVEPGETRPAPESSTVIPGQPRKLPPLDASTPVDSTQMEKSKEPASSGVVPAQFTTPAAPKSAAPTVLYPEPPTPVVRISVKGVDTAPSGQELTFKLIVTNTSEARAHNVIVRCPVPKNAKLIKALPQPNTEGKELEWQLETLDANSSRTIEVVFKPNDDVSEISVVGRVQFEHGRVVKTRIASPNLQMKKTGPAEGILHTPMTYRIVVSNPGRVPVTDIQVVDSLPDGLEYVQESMTALPVSKVGPAPNQRTWEIGTMRPSESRTIEYRVLPRKTGEWTSEAIATGSGAQVKAGCNTAVQEARLTLQVTGPANDKATANVPTPYLIHVHNTGTAILHNVRVSCAFPSEMRLAKASNGGQMFKDAVQWLLPKLGPKESKELSVSVTAPSAGLRDVVVSARADRGLEQRKKVPTVFEGIPALNWQTEGTPVAAVGQEIAYTITVTNPGSAPARNVKISVDLPDSVEFRQALPGFQRGPSAIFFNPLEIQPKQSVALKVVVNARKAGEARFHFELNAEGMSSGPLRNNKTTTISPSGDSKKEPDPTRIGKARAPEKLAPELAAEPRVIVPAIHVSPERPSSPPGP
jgi:uncharacterized repeat protein (TIGR01451 family)